MRTNFAIDDTNGFLVLENQLVLVEGKEAIAVNCTTETQTLLGEDPYLQDKGMPNFETVWKGNPNIPAFESALRETILNIQDVFNTSDFSYTLEDGILNYELTVQTISGNTTLAGSTNA